MAIFTKMRFAFYTLGCKTNQYETQAMEHILQNQGHEIGHFDEKCDAYIINTCSVTAIADKKNRAVIRRCRRENPRAVIGVCGCYTQHAPEAVKELGVDVLGGSGGRQEFLEHMLAALQGEDHVDTLDNALRRREFELLPPGGLEERTRAMLKVQDGCVNFCTYCIIPYTRGRVRSLPVEQAAKQARELDEKGYRELVVTGIEVASYGVDLKGKPDLADVIVAIAEAAPHMRLRMGSIEPSIITEDFCRRIAETGSVCRHFHLSLQSGCDATLKAMNRKYDTARFFEATELLRKYFPGCGLTADLIVGFPGETEEHQRETLEFLEKVAFSDVHVFPYSRRPGTPADKMPNQIDRAEKARRSKQARAVAEKTRRAYLESAVGTVLPVLFETKEGGLWQGHSDTYLLVRVEGEELRGQIRNVEITGVSGDTLVGKTV